MSVAVALDEFVNSQTDQPRDRDIVPLCKLNYMMSTKNSDWVLVRCPPHGGDIVRDQEDRTRSERVPVPAHFEVLFSSIDEVDRGKVTKALSEGGVAFKVSQPPAPFAV